MGLHNASVLVLDMPHYPRESSVPITTRGGGEEPMHGWMSGPPNIPQPSKYKVGYSLQDGGLPTLGCCWPFNPKAGSGGSEGGDEGEIAQVFIRHSELVMRHL